jgi:hypothetical protein
VVTGWVGGLDGGREGTDSSPAAHLVQVGTRSVARSAKASGRAIRVSCESGWRNNAYSGAYDGVDEEVDICAVVIGRGEGRCESRKK